LIYDAEDKASNKWLKENKTKAQLIPFSIERELEFEISFVRYKRRI